MIKLKRVRFKFPEAFTRDHTQVLEAEKGFDIRFSPLFRLIIARDMERGGKERAFSLDAVESYDSVAGSIDDLEAFESRMVARGPGRPKES